MEQIRKIDLLKYRGAKSTLFTGRPQGERVRDELGLDNIDKTDEKLIFVIPKGTTSINPSFFLGLLFDSIKDLGIQRFEQKYSFEFEDESKTIQNVLIGNLMDGKRNALNTIEKKGSFRDFLNL